MASSEQAATDEFVLAENMYADGIEALEQSDFVEASDFLAQCLQFHAERSGDTSVDAALVALKYAEALLGCSRMKGSSILSGLGKNNKARDPSGASTSSGTSEAVQRDETADDETGGDEDLDLAWEVAETARVGMTNNLDSSQVTKDTLTELYELLGDICAERELFTEALIDYETALSTVAELEELDPRWEAEIQFKVSNTMEILDRGPEAQEHIQAAMKLISKLIKEKKSDLAALQKASAAAEKSGNPKVVATAGAAAAEAPEELGEPSADAATPTSEEGAEMGPTETAAANDEEKEPEETEESAFEDEIKDLQGVLDELKERSKDLIVQKQQEAAIKEQLRATLGLPTAKPGGAGTSQAAGGSSSGAAGITFGGSTLENGAQPTEGAAKADAAAADGVQDLGVISSKRKRDASAVDAAPEGKGEKFSKTAASESEVENVAAVTTGDATA